MDETKILIIGAKGQLGTALSNKYPKARAVDADSLDITNQDQLNKFDFSGIEYILNVAAYTNVDGAETEEGRTVAWQVNSLGVANLASIAIKKDITLLHISTDYVFDGKQSLHTEDEKFSPLSVYGSTKAAADLLVSLVPKHYILRTSWVIGDGHNFVRTMLEVGRKGIAPKVVNDQIGRLTFTSELVRAIDHLIQSRAAYGTYNATNDGKPASWADITRSIFSLASFNLGVTNITTEAYYADKPEAAKRPLNSSLNLDKLKGLGFEPTDWKTDLELYVKKELSQ